MQQNCPVLALAQRYDLVAKQWLDSESDVSYQKLGYMVLAADQLTPQSITGATFQIACAVSELDVIARGSDAPHIRLAAERRVLRLLRNALILLEERSADLPSAWKFVVPAGDGQLKRKYGSN
ncbi:hypothetical protein [Bradyrhizobium sp. UNPA324]|uniref:hypothetical protein n=1 Tax=Bradyrhizobium sp. UNPA324 TaxID=1141174 RepID=UPI001151B086|nr:hypothetical protein [Bradyrhizobium sp. UNPA324]TQF28858.1 hypothetical protein UNPA324_03745 [Bradyrhizobium sp. UNPA324]